MFNQAQPEQPENPGRSIERPPRALVPGVVVGIMVLLALGACQARSAAPSPGSQNRPASAQGGNANQASQGARNTVPAGTASRPLTPAEEAYKKSEEFWKTKFTHCNGDTYLGYDSRSSVKDLQINQYKNWQFTMKTGDVSEADRLNGIEYRGESEVAATSRRVYMSGKWGEWQMGYNYGIPHFLRLTKKNGKWEVKPNNLDNYYKVQCNDIPK